MRKYTKQEVEASGYDSGITLAIWFSVIPSKLIVPPNMAAYKYEWIKACNRGFNDRRAYYAKVMMENEQI